MKTTLQSLIDDVTIWHYNRNLISGSTDKDQYMKLTQETGELSDSICKGKDIRDDIGDIMVVLINIAERNGLSLQECLQVAYDDIKHRKGRMVDGVFVKEQDWPTDERIDAIGQNGGDGAHYDKVKDTGVYEA
jgi:uncharacterized protein YabN with tetrapyrrole methylase and pyrophosphatase domain